MRNADRMYNFLRNIFIFLYFLCLAAISLSFFSYSHAFLILPISFALTFILSKHSRTARSAKDNFPQTSFYLYLLFIYITLFVYQQTTSYIFGQDSISSYLPLSRYFAFFRTYQGPIPNASSPDYFTGFHGYPPLLITLAGILFQITYTANEYIASLLPYVFIFLLMFLFYYNGICTSMQFLAVFFVLTFSPLIIMNMSWFYQDLPLALFVFAAIMFVVKYSETKRNDYFVMAFLSANLAALTKYPGLLVLIFIFLYGLAARVFFHKSTFWICLVFIAAPILWYSRNVYLFHMPTPPFQVLQIDHFESLKDWVPLRNNEVSFTIYLQYFWDFWRKYVFPHYPNQFSDLLKALGNTWIIGLGGLFLLFRYRNWKRVHFFILLFLALYLLFWFRTKLYDPRYLMPIFVLSLYASTKMIGRFIVPDDPASLERSLLKKILSTRVFHIVIVVFCLSTSFYVSYINLAWARALKKDYKVIFADLSKKLNTSPENKAFIDSDFGFKWYTNTYLVELDQIYPTMDFLSLLEKRMKLRQFFEKYQIGYVIDSHYTLSWEKPFLALLERYPWKEEIYSRPLRYKGETAYLRVWSVEY